MLESGVIDSFWEVLEPKAFRLSCDDATRSPRLIQAVMRERRQNKDNDKPDRSKQHN